MGQYYLTLDGSHSLPEIEAALNAEQALAAEFLDSQLAAVSGRITNLLTFAEADDVPPDVRVLQHPSSPPIGRKAIWSGVMLVASSNTVVDVYR